MRRTIFSTISRAFLRGDHCGGLLHDASCDPSAHYCFSGNFAPFVVGVLVLDMVTRVDYLKEKFRWLRWLEHKSAVGPLLLVCILLLIGNGYELYEKEVPEVAAPNPPQLVPPTNFGIDKSGSKVRGQKLKLSKTGRTGTADTIEVALNCQLQNLPFMIEPNSALRIVGLNEEFSKAYEQMGAPIQVEHARNSKNSRLAWPDPDQVDRLIRKGQREDTFASIVR